MSSSNIWISVNYISNWFTAVTTAFNVLWMLEMCINAIIQKKDLQDYIDASKDWKTPLVIMTVLAVVSTGIIYVTPLGIFAFVISLFALGFQIFFMVDYSRMVPILNLCRNWNHWIGDWIITLFADHNISHYWLRTLKPLVLI